jgi:hypothetical protein
MKLLKKNSKRYLAFRCYVILCIILASAVSIFPNNRATVNSNRNKQKKLQIEIYSGVSSLKPGDLNLLPRADALSQEFLYEGYNNFLYNNRYIIAWSEASAGEYQEITNGIPLGIRVKYYLNSSLALSLGFRYISREQTSNPSFYYLRTQPDGEEYMDKKDFSLYTLSARGYAPLIGIHLEKSLSKIMTLEGYVAGGPLFTRCRYAVQWQSELLDINTDPFLMLYEETGSLEQEGEGTGISLEGGVRINVSLGNHLGVFLGAGYIYQSAGDISGKGKEVRGSITREWDDIWAIKQENLISFWGEQTLEFPTNYWQDETGGTRARDFTLDLSGFQIQMGLFFRF